MKSKAEPSQSEAARTFLSPVSQAFQPAWASVHVADGNVADSASTNFAGGRTALSAVGNDFIFFERTSCPRSFRAGRSHRGGFTLVEVLVALVLMAVIIPIAVEGLRLATLAGEVSQRKELAARIADKVLNEAIVSGQNQYASAGDEQSAGYQFHWTMKDQPFNQLRSVQVTTTPNGVNQNGVNQTIIHEVSVDVTFAAQGKNFDVLLSTLVNMSHQ